MSHGRLLVLACLCAVAPLAGQTWSQLSPTGGPPAARQGHSAVLDSAANQMIVFGGMGGGVDFNDIWSLSTSVSSPQWTSVAAVGSAPPARTGHSAVYDSTNSRMTIFGGGLPCANDVWVLSNANRVNGSPAWTQLSPSGTAPAARIFHTAVYDATSNRMIVFGGSNCASAGAQFYNDVWILSNANGLGGTPTWTQLSPSGGPPAVRENHTAVYDAGSNRMMVFGGTANGSFFNDVWALSNANGLGGASAWTQISPSGTPISSRAGHTAVYQAGANRMIVFGGANASGSIVNDVWALSNANGLSGASAWSQIFPAGTSPVARDEHTAVYDAGSSRMIVFAGASAVASLNDTWVLNLLGYGATTTTTLTSSLNPSTYGQSITLTASVAPSAANGYVAFYAWAVAGIPQELEGIGIR